MKKVVVIGGGFAGLNLTKGLGNQKDLQVLLVDKRNHHLFQPLLYQVAMAALSPAEIAYPIRSLIKKYRNVDVLLGEVQDVDLENKIIEVASEKISYDYLVFACGSTHSYFGHNSWEEHAPGLKTLAQATEIRRRVLYSFEQASSASDDAKRRWHLTFVIIGGGPTGVELAGSIAEISRQSIRKDFRNLDTARSRVILLEGGSRILGGYSEKQSAQAAKALEKLGVQVWTQSLVTEISEKGVAIGDQEFVSASTVLWAAGVSASPLNKKLNVELSRDGRIVVDEYLQIPGFESAFVLGDQAYCLSSGEALPGLAPVAIQQGRYLAKQLKKRSSGKSFKKFHYLDKGQMATIGRNQAVLSAFGIELSGMIAWLGWLFIHILYLVGFKNRLFVLMQWSWSYLSFKKGARLIIDREWRSYPRQKTGTDNLTDDL